MIIYSLAVLFLQCVYCGRTRSPNIVIFIVDDLGIGDVGCFGNDTLNTPNMDRICQNGMKLTHNLAAAPLCSPSRAAFLTGRYPIRSGSIRIGPRDIPVYSTTLGSGGLPTNETTFGKILKSKNYTNGFFGKWHQGIHGDDIDFKHLPLNHGFDYFYGMPLTYTYDCGPWYEFRTEYLLNGLKIDVKLMVLSFTLVLLCVLKKNVRWIIFPVMVALTCFIFKDYLEFIFLRKFRCIVMRNRQVVEQTAHLETATKTLTKEVQEFIQQNKETNFLAVVSYYKVHTPLVPSSAFAGGSKHGKYGDVVEEVDWSVGKVMKTLEDLGLVDNTFVYFTSDHGPALFVSHKGHYDGGSKGHFRGGKSTNFEGGIRVPTMVQWPGVIPAGSTHDQPTSLMDVLPTLAAIVDAPYNADIVDGVNILPVLKGEQGKSSDRFLFHYCDVEIQAVTYIPAGGVDVYKVFYSLPNFKDGTEICWGNSICVCSTNIPLNKPLLFNLVSDPSESDSLTPDNSLYKGILDVVETAIKKQQKSVIDVEGQMSPEKRKMSYKKIPSLCCNFPLCYC